MTTPIVEMFRQIGGMNLLAISGGRHKRIDDHTIELPVRYGYAVRVTYERGRDTYLVQQIFRRGTREWIKKEATDVYHTELGEVAYRMSCFQN